MFPIRKQALSRRAFLRGAGAAISLPFLDAMVPACARYAHASPLRIHRFETFYVPNGMAMQHWQPRTLGRDFRLPPILAQLARHRERMLVLSGIDATWTLLHAGASGSFLTAITHGGKNEIDIIGARSFDQHLAQELARQTPLPSLELSLDRGANAGSCSAAQSCVYTHTLCWRGPRQPLPMEWNPRVVFELIFGDSGSSDPAARMARLRQQKSLLDSVRSDLAALQRKLGPGDRLKLDQFASAVREVETKIANAESRADIELPAKEQPRGAPASFEEHLDMILDLKILALQSDTTRVVSFMLSKEQSARSYPQIGVPEAHHPLSHHNDRKVQVAKMTKINQYHAHLFSKYLDRLAATPDGEHSLLDNMTILYGSGISHSSAHSGKSLPILLVGGGAGWLRGGEHRVYPRGSHMGNLLLALGSKMGLTIDRIGETTKALSI